MSYYNNNKKNNNKNNNNNNNNNNSNKNNNNSSYNNNKITITALAGSSLTDGFVVVLGEAHSARVRHHLIRQHDRHAKLLGQTSQLTQELAQTHLTL
jgi:hypothetical protein